MKDFEIQRELSRLAAAVAPWTESEFQEAHDNVRAKRLTTCLTFKNYIWAIVCWLLMFLGFTCIAFGIIFYVSSIDSFGNPTAIAATFTAIPGFLYISYLVLDLLYATRQIGCKDMDYTPEEVQELTKSTNLYFTPGVLYDDRILQNRIDVNCIRWYPFAIFLYSVLILWLENPGSHVASESSVSGVRYAMGHTILFGIQVMCLYALISNIYAMWRRRARLDTLRIDLYFEVDKYWEEEDEREKPGGMLQ
jgi:hypothetical protein